MLQKTRKGWHLVGPSWLRLIALAGFGGIGTLLYALQIEPRWIDWRHRRLQIEGLSRAFNGYRLVQLSDLHLAEGKLLTPIDFQQLIRQVNDLHPDAVVITGDFVSRFDATSRAGIAELAELQTRDGVFAVSGNHDYWTDIRGVVQAVEAAGVTFLTNAHHLIRRASAELVIAGVDDVWEGAPDLDQALRGVSPETPVILLAHEPNYAEIAVRERRVKLQLSGHSHGGQVRIPGVGPLALPDLAWAYPMGLYQVPDAKQPSHNLWVYTNRGLGLAEMPLRFHCRPEVTIFHLTGRA